jgi:hypothetical protein
MNARHYPNTRSAYRLTQSQDVFFNGFNAVLDVAFWKGPFFPFLSILLSLPFFIFLSFNFQLLC